VGSAEMRPVEVGEYNDEFIEIRSGLKEGDKVLLRAPEGVEKDQGDSGSETDTENGAAPAPAAGTRPPATAALSAPPGAPRSAPKAGGSRDGGGAERSRSN